MDSAKIHHGGIIVDKKYIYIVFEILKETYRKAKLPLEDISLFKSVFDILVPKGYAKFFSAKYKELNIDNYIGVMIILTYSGVVYDWYAGAHDEYLSLCPNDLLAWHAIGWSSEKGYHIFDFGGAGKPNNKEHEGIRRFKEQFGGQLVNFGRYKKIYSPRKLWLAKKGFDVWRMLKL